jgi:drug/metabolite transporter (DMT)-like permease
MTGPPSPPLAEPATPAARVFRGSALRGVALMLISTVVLSGMHASIRYLSETVHPFEIAFFRNLFALVVVLPWFVRYGAAPLRTSRFGLHVLRAALNVTAMLSFFYALSLAPLSEVTALGFTAPIFATLLAAPILREAVGLQRWSAILVGFAGTLIILRPGFESVGPGQLLTLFSSLVWALALMTIKTLSRSEPSVTIVTYMGLLMIPLSLAPALLVWQWPDAWQLSWLALIGLLGGIGQFAMTEALRQADTAVVMPVDFSKLIWATLLAWLAFGEVPDGFTWLGGGVIFVSTFYITYRERQRTKSPVSVPTTTP